MKLSIPRIENTVVAAALAGMILLPFLEILSRLVFRSGLTSYEDILKHTTLWVGMMAALVASRTDEHISFGFAASKIHKKASPLARGAHAAIAWVEIAFCLALTVSSLSFILIGFDPGRRVLGIPIALVVGILPVATLGMALGYMGKTSQKRRFLIPLLTAALLFGLFLSLPAMLNLFYSSPLMPPGWLENLQDGYYGFFQGSNWLFIIILVALTLYGLPIYIFLGGTALLLFAGNGGVPEVMPNEIYTLLTGTAIPAIPLFTLSGFILSQGKSGERLVHLFQAVIGKFPGGLAIMAVLICAFFTTFTGASGVTILALGGLLTFILNKSGGYSKKFVRGLLTSSGSIGLLFPPSLPIIMYAVTAQISVKEMFLGGILPGGLLVLALSLIGILHQIRHKKQEPPRDIQPSQTLRLWPSIRNALGDLFLPGLILILYFGGITTLVETGAVAVVYVLLLETVVFRELRVKDLKYVFRRAVPVIGGVLIILAMAKGLSYFIVDAEVPTALTAFLQSRVRSPIIFLLLLNLVLLVTGCFMDIYSAIMVVAPLIIPLGEAYGIHPVQLGIIFLANLQLGYLTPPVGLNLFLASYTFKTPLSEIYRGVIPFFLILLVVVLLISYVPWFSLLFLF